jgi:hypothetical protein
MYWFPHWRREPAHIKAERGGTILESGKKYRITTRLPFTYEVRQSEHYFSHVEGWYYVFSDDPDLRNTFKYVFTDVIDAIAIE